MNNWEYDPVPRYYFFLGDVCLGEVIFDGFRGAACNGFAEDGEVWHAIVDETLLGRFGSLQEAQKAVRARILDRGLALV